MLSGPYDPGAQQAKLVAARGAMTAESLSSNSSTPLGNAPPFEYTPDAVRGGVKELAASTNNENFAAKMLGYNRKTFGKMIHMTKEDNNLRGDDNVIWHDDGGVEFNGEIIDNMHSYAP